jgi:hypothetical protein
VVAVWASEDLVVGGAGWSSRNRNRPSRGWPSAATIRHTTVYRPLARSGASPTRMVSRRPEPYPVFPTSTRRRLGPRTWMPPNASSTASLNRITTAVGARWTVDPAFGSVDRTRLWALTVPAHSPTAMAASPSRTDARLNVRLGVIASTPTPEGPSQAPGPRHLERLHTGTPGGGLLGREKAPPDLGTGLRFRRPVWRAAWPVI